MIIKVIPEDEYLHVPKEDPLWWENYHFNAYDPVEKVGITTYAAVKPFLGVREEIVTLYPGDPLFFQKQTNLEKDALVSGSLKMEPLQPLKKWRIQMKDSFQKTENTIPLNDTEKVEFDLHFEHDMTPYRYTTERGDRYEQPGSLKGKIQIGDTTINFNGKGIRDHSWEIRNIRSWGEYYAFMGRFGPGVISCVYMQTGSAYISHGWVRTGKCFKIINVQVNPAYSGDVLKECTMHIETSDGVLEFHTRLLSSVTISMGKEQKKAKAVEMLMDLEIGNNYGHGFLWCRG